MEKVLPKGWVETEFGAINQRSVTKHIDPSNFPEERFELYSVPIFETGQPEFQLGEDIKSSKQLVKCGDVLVCKINPRINRVWIVDDYSPFTKIASSEWIVIGNELINSLFLKYQFQSKQFRTLLQSEVSGVGGSLTRARPKLVNTYPIFLPPLSEQKRIVAKLDKLFAQRERMKKALDRIPRLLKDFRQQVLTQAVTGKLTEKWREGKELEEWKNLNLIDVILEKPRNGYSPRAVEYATPLKSLSLSATTSGKFDPSFVKYIDESKPPQSSHLWLNNGDILIQRSNSLDYVGTAAIYDGVDYDFIYPDIMMKVRANKLVENKFLYFILSSEKTKKYYKENATGTAGNMPKINQEIVSRTPVLLPPLQEQQEIVHRVESLFAKADAIEVRYQTLKIKIDNLPQAILHKAFKGELVAQLPTDGDAKELLAEIMALKAEPKGTKRK